VSAGAVTDARRRAVAALLDRVKAWSARRPDLRAAALVGSLARNEARMDSDVDLVLLTDAPTGYTARDEWAPELGAASVGAAETWGVAVSRRLELPDGLEVEVLVVAPSWAATAPVDPGTARVAQAGLATLHDPDGRLEALLATVRRHNPS